MYKCRNYSIFWVTAWNDDKCHWMPNKRTSDEDLALTIFTLSSHSDLVNTTTSNAQDFTVTWLTTEAAVYHGVRVTLVPFKTIKRMSYARNTLRNGVPLSRTFCCDTDFKLEFIGCLKTFRRGHCIYLENPFIKIIS